MSTLQKFAILIFLACVSLPSLAQDIGASMASYFDQVRSGNYQSVPELFLLTQNAASVLRHIEPYFNDSTDMVRAKAYAMVALVGSSTSELKERNTAVVLLIRGCRDKNSGNAGIALEYLTTFNAADYTVSAKDSIRQLFKKEKTAYFDKLLKFAGFLELTDLKETIRDYSKQGNPQSIRWAAVVSLARMNDNEASAEMMRRVRKLPVNDDVIYEVFPDLVYSRHPEAIAYMVEVLKSDEEHCLTADAEREVPIPCGYRIMEQLAPVIAKYPLELDESGDIKTKDYVAALKKARDWFEKNNNYKILRDKY